MSRIKRDREVEHSTCIEQSEEDAACVWNTANLSSWITRVMYSYEAE